MAGVAVVAFILFIIAASLQGEQTQIEPLPTTTLAESSDIFLYPDSLVAEDFFYYNEERGVPVVTFVDTGDFSENFFTVPEESCTWRGAKIGDSSTGFFLSGGYPSSSSHFAFGDKSLDAYIFTDEQHGSIAVYMRNRTIYEIVVRSPKIHQLETSIKQSTPSAYDTHITITNSGQTNVIVLVRSSEIPKADFHEYARETFSGVNQLANDFDIPDAIITISLYEDETTIISSLQWEEDKPDYYLSRIYSNGRATDRIEVFDMETGEFIPKSVWEQWADDPTGENDEGEPDEEPTPPDDEPTE